MSKITRSQLITNNTNKITTNGNQDITGAVLNGHIRDMIDSFHTDEDAYTKAQVDVLLANNGTLSGLTDVNFSTLVQGDFIQYSGGSWVNIPTSSFPQADTLVNGGVVYYNTSTGKLSNSTGVIVSGTTLKATTYSNIGGANPLQFSTSFPVINFGETTQENLVNFYGSVVIDDAGNAGFVYTSQNGSMISINNSSNDNQIQNMNDKFVLYGANNEVSFTINDSSIVSGRVNLNTAIGSIQTTAGSSAVVEVDENFVRMSHSGDNYIDIDENEIEITVDNGSQKYIRITDNDIDITHFNQITLNGYLDVDNISVSTYSNYQTYTNASPSQGDLWYDGNNFRLKGGGIVLEDTVWDDLRVPLSMTTTGPSSSPGFTIFRDAVYSYAFDDTSNESLYFTCQMPHTWKTGTTIYPHIHWSKNHTNAGNVEWGLEYSWASINTGFTATATITASGSSQTQYTHNLTALQAISGVGKGISSMLVCRVYRNAVSGSDTMTGDAHMLEIDFHYEIDRLGTDNEYTNN